MVKSTIRFFILTVAFSVIYFFTFGGIIGFALTEEGVNVPLVVIFMFLNILIYAAIWIAALKVPPYQENVVHGLDYLVLHMPTIFYLVCTLGLLTADLLLGDIAITTLGTLKYFYQMICPLGINTVMAISIVDSIDTYVYYLSVFLNLLLYAVVITIAFKRKSRINAGV